MRCNFLFPFLLLIAPLSGCAITYSANPITARVVDAETKEPIENVIVVAHWQLKGGMEGGNNVGQMNVLETETDKNGQFYFPGWGPKLRSLSGKLKDQSPAILLFKNGYRYRGLLNELNRKTLYGDLDVPLKSDWDGKTIKMEKFKGTMEEYAEHVHNLSSRDLYLMLDFARGDKECNWQRVPRILVALHREGLYFENQGIKLSGWRLGEHPFKIDDIPRHCGSPNEFLRSYLP